MLSVTPWVTPKEVSEVSSEHVAMEQTSYTRNNLPHESKLADITKISKIIYI